MSDLSNTAEITATLSAVESLVGELSVPSVETPEEYSGSYSVTPSEDVQTLATRGLLLTNNVTVGAISPTYVGSEIPRRDENYVEIDDGYIVVSCGYYEENALKELPLESKTVTPTESAQVITPTTAGDLLSSVTVNPIPDKYKDMSGELAWMGADAEHVGQLYTQTISLAGTNFATWTPSTTAASIQATANVATFVPDMPAYDYIIRWTMDARIAYQEGATMKAATVRDVSQVYQAIFRRPGNLAALRSDTFATNACMTLASAYYADYFNTSGTEAMAYTASYGIYQTVQTATFSSSSSASPTVTVKRPVLYARCSTTYWATARAAEVDQDNSTVTLTAELFRVPSSGILRRMYETLADFYNE